MKLDEILSAAGRYKPRKRLGRGIGSGHGKTAGRGTKGGGARSGWRQRLGHEGGQNPVIARSPKRGFTNAGFRREFQVVNVCDLESMAEGDRVDPAAMAKAGVIRDARKPVKVLGNGSLSRKLTVAAHGFSESAAAKIAQAGGTVERLPS